MKTKKKGFTLVELLVVIAILAVLATVTTVGYLSFTEKAKESNDISLTTELNTVLFGNEALEGKNKTPHDAVLDLKDEGYDITRLTPTKGGYEFVWVSSQDKFFLLDGDKVVSPTDGVLSSNKHDVFKFIGKGEQLSEVYSNYLKPDYESTNGTETISTGFDAGDNTTVTTLNYNNTTTKTTTIRTNGGSLTVTAPNDTVHHYGDANVVDVVAVDLNNSYHEFGQVGTVKVASGRVVIEESKTTNVSSVYIVKAAVGSTDLGVKVEINNTQSNSTTVSKDDNVNADKLVHVQNNGSNIVPTTGVTVSTLDDLKSAILGNSESIYLNNDIDLLMVEKAGIIINRPLSLYGNGHKIYTNNAKMIEGARLIQINGFNDGVVSFNDVSIESSTWVGYMRGIQIHETLNSELVLNRVNLTIPHYYALNIGYPVTNLKVSINESSIAGWATVYNHGSDVTLTARNSNFDSTNPVLGGGSTNSFGNIIVADYFENDGPGYFNNNNKFTFNDCEFTSNKKNPDANVDQVICDIRSPYNNNAYFNNCNFKETASPKYIKVCQDTSYCNDLELRKKMYQTSRVYINNNDVTLVADYVERYLDCSYLGLNNKEFWYNPSLYFEGFSTFKWLKPNEQFEFEIATKVDNVPKNYKIRVTKDLNSTSEKWICTMVEIQ